MKNIAHRCLIFTAVVCLIFSNSCKKEELKKQSESDLTESNMGASEVRDDVPKKQVTLLGSAEMFQDHGTSNSDIVGDLEMIEHALKQYRKLYQQHPVGLNDEITAALTGANLKSLAFIDPAHPSIIGHELHDRYGSPYHFHQNSGSSMTVTSAGKDKKLFTKDDQRIHSH